MKRNTWNSFTVFLQTLTQTWRYNSKIHEPIKKKMKLPCFELRWILKGVRMPWNCFYFHFLFRTDGKRKSGWERLPSLLWYFIRKYQSETTWSQLCLKFFYNNWEAFGRQQLKILQTWIDIGTNHFLSKFLETKIDESVWKIIYIITRTCSSKNITPRHFTCCFMLLFLSNKPSF